MKNKALDELNEKLDDFINKINKLPDYYIEIGVFSEETNREEKYRVGVTNAELMFIHENGSPLQSIPKRPVLHMTLNYGNQELFKPTLNRAIQKYVESKYDLNVFEEELNKLCLRLENYARKIIYSNDGRLAPNSPSVAKAKKGNHPLFDTGQLARSITCRLIKL